MKIHDLEFFLAAVAQGESHAPTRSLLWGSLNRTAFCGAWRERSPPMHEIDVLKLHGGVFPAPLPLYEKSRFLRHKVCGEFLSPELAPTLQSPGLSFRQALPGDGDC